MVLRGPRDDARFDPERIEHRDEHPSPSGRYRLVITRHRAPDKGWSYSLGVITREQDGAVLAEVRRNFGHFPFCWMEGHVDGHDYLVCGEDYQGQTFCQLDTAEVFQHLPDAAFDGHGFCWADYRLLSDGRTLLVDGCYWACPYELRLYDVSDPASGWPRIPWPSGMGENGDESHLSAGTLREEEGDLIWEDPEDDNEPVRERRVFRQVDGRVSLVEAWVSEELLEQRRQLAERRTAQQTQHATWMQQPLYQALEAHAPPDRGDTWFQYPSVRQREAGETNPAHIEVSACPHDRDRDLTGSVTWGVREGLIVATRRSREARSSEERAFPRSAVGMREAWDWVQEHIAREPEG
ncbi:MAG: hypothetical protein KTR31_11170 [Myxococcales bacterium]|nr:hypothetical protein [Myxococcales bacterium]